VEGGETDAEEIGRTAKIKHTQNKQRKNNTGKNQNQKTGRTNKNKIQRETKQEQGNKTPNDQPERLGQDLAGSTAEEGGDGRKARWGRADDLPQAAGYENAEIRKTKAGKKADNKKKEREGKEKKKKGRDTGTRASSK
jgi:hypothetical protein